MRAWQVHRHGSPRDALRLVDVDEPVPGPGEVRLQVRAAAVGLPDALMCRASYPFRPTLPFVAGQEVCGIVDALGGGVDLPIGERLMAVTSFFDGHGGFAEATIARADSAFRVPETMREVDAASFRIGYSTAWTGLVRRGALQAGEWLLVLGAAGGSGLAALQLGRALGARVIAVVAGTPKRDLCVRMGAAVVIDRATQSVADAVSDATGGAGVDLVYDPVGGIAAGATVGCLASGGRLLAVGFASGAWVDADISQLVWRSSTAERGLQRPQESHEQHAEAPSLAVGAPGGRGRRARHVRRSSGAALGRSRRGRGVGRRGSPALPRQPRHRRVRLSCAGTRRLHLPRRWHRTPLGPRRQPAVGTAPTRDGHRDRPGCWTFRVEYSTNHEQETFYCARDRVLEETGGQTKQRFNFGAFAVDDTQDFTCRPPGQTIRVAARPGDSWRQSCTGHSVERGTTVT